jgi:hypothetical protein
MGLVASLPPGLHAADIILRSAEAQGKWKVAGGAKEPPFFSRVACDALGAVGWHAFVRVGM